MKIEPISNGNLRIWLADDEVQEWGLDDSHGEGVRRLVRRALTATGRRASSRMWAEMIPVEGGCVVLVSPAVHSRRLPMVYAVTAEHLADVYARWHPSSEETAQVYAVGEEYHVVLYGDAGDTLLREYGRPLGSGEGMAAHTAEYGEWVGQITAPAPVLPEPEDQGR